MLPACGLLGDSATPDQRLEDALLPRASDLPAGWVEVSKTRQRYKAKCLPDERGIVQTADDGATGHGVDFTRARVGKFAALAQIFRTEALAKSAFGREATPAVAGCLSELLYETLVNATGPSDMALVGAPSVGPLRLDTVGDESRAYQVTVSIATPEQTLEVYVEFAAFRVHRGIATDLVVTFQDPFDTDAFTSLMARAARRAAGTAGA